MRRNASSEIAPARRKHLLIAFVVFLLGVTLSLVASQWAREEMRKSAQARFDTLASNAVAQVERRFASYVELLTGLRALFHTGDVSREAFRRFADALVLQRDLPGFQVLNYAPYVPAASKDAFEKAMRQDPSLPARVRFAIDPPGVRDGYHPFTLIEPLAGNEHLLGRDIAATPQARAALDAARDTGKLTSSARLIQTRGPQGQMGLAMRMPVYRVGVPTDTLAQRRAAYVGSVGAGFLVADMFKRLPGVPQGVRLRLYDGGSEPIVEQAGDAVPQDDKLLFDTLDAGGRRQPDGGSKQPGPAAEDRFRQIKSFVLGDRLWLVEASAPFAEGAGALERMLPGIVLASGVVISASLAGALLGMLGWQRRRGHAVDHPASDGG
jgi:CHASE1-domain containing sensor protein